jgi:hypothetical protein
MKTLCEYHDWFIVEEKGDSFVIREDEKPQKVKLVKTLNPKEYERKDISEILDLCEDYDFSGELDDFSAYCFWKIVDEPCVADNLVNTFYLDKEQLKKAMICLRDNGIEPDECPVVLQTLCYILLDKEIDPLLELLDEEEDIEKLLSSQEEN